MQSHVQDLNNGQARCHETPLASYLPLHPPEIDFASPLAERKRCTKEYINRRTYY